MPIPQKKSLCLIAYPYVKSMSMPFYTAILYFDWYNGEFFYCNILQSYILYWQEKYEEATAALAEMEKRAVMAESMLEATLQYQSGQVKVLQSPRYISF